MSTQPAPRRRLSTAAVVALVAVVLVVGLVVAGVAYVASGAWYVEMACSEGEAPADHVSGGSDCFEEGSDLPPGYTWDPRGNYRIV